jgi:predicted RNase H-like HicB family nuclease
MKKYFYPAIFSKEGKAYNVKFIDFEDIFTYGIGFDDAYYMAQDALYNMLPEYKDNLPKPTFDYMNLKLKKDEFVTMVELDMIEHERKISSKTVKTTVTMPEWLKNLADTKGLNFSKLLQESIKNELNLL